MNRPQVSLLMAVHNGAAFLPEALDSLRSQSFRPFEFVIVDDASNDDSGAMLKEFDGGGRPVMVLRNPQRQGLAASLNRGLAACRAELVARADADDIYHPQRLARQVTALRADDNIGVLSCAYRRMQQNGEVGMVQRPLLEHDQIAFSLLLGNPILHPGVVFRRDLVQAHGGYDEQLWTAQDSELWLRLRDKTRFANIPDVLVHYRIHAAAITASRGSAGERLSMSVKQRGLSSYLGRAMGHEETSATIHYYQGYREVRDADIRIARRVLKEMAPIVRRREPREVFALFQARRHLALIRQAELRSNRPGAALLLGAKAFLSRPGFYSIERLLHYAARAVVRG